ncbi:uncharacterized protein KY384_005536 [Bacidia gigantensis]|uniref:uncharacterized protein n=1 Tax=Bacidia gigantensis TaxID=2732470 RepID=UPI001D043DD3|nr:uncharacterized protein KY384_005536 [Bacidia gigantensis]KAG8530054.1 hypothetical protein KY384_005536 [Bacidia gigantensis]
MQQLAPAPQPLRAAPSENATEQALRERLLASVQPQHLPEYQQRRQENHASNPHSHNIDPAIAGSNMMSQHMSGDVSDGDGPERRGKRELSTSKRAAQNRAAQRAFRQRKESHIKDLETRIREYDNLNTSYKAIQNENYALREYIIALQGNLLQNKGSYPPPPPHINLHSGRAPLADSNVPRTVESRSGVQEEPERAAPTASMRALEDHIQASAAHSLNEQRDEALRRPDSDMSKRPRISEESHAHGLPQRTQS